MPAQKKTILYKSKAYLCETSWVVIHTNMLTYMLYLILNHTLYTLSVIYVICCVVGAWMQTFLCHLFSLGLILPQSLSFHTPVHFSSLPLSFHSQLQTEGHASLNHNNNNPLTWGFLFVRVQERAPHSITLAVPLDSHQPPVPHPSCDPSTQSYASLHRWRVAGLTVGLSWDAAWRKMKRTWCSLLDDPAAISLLLFICLCYSDLPLRAVYISCHNISQSRPI